MTRFIIYAVAILIVLVNPAAFALGVALGLGWLWWKVKGWE